MVSVEVTEHQTYTDIAISGVLTIFSAREFFHTHIKPLSFSQSLILDLSAIEEIDTAGIQVLLLLCHAAKQTGQGCEVSDISPVLNDYLDVFNLKDQFPLSGLIVA